MAKRLKVRKQPIYFLIAIILIVLGVIFSINKYNEYLYHQTIEYKLLEHGYSKEEYELLKQYRNEKELEKLLDEKKNNTIISLMQEKYYMNKNYDRYLDYQKKHKNKSFTDIVALVNVNVDYEWYENDLEADIKNEYGILVNKYYKLKEEYEPEDIVSISSWYAYANNKIKKEVDGAFIEMFNAAKEDGKKIIVNSSFRDYKSQAAIYESYYNHHGRDYADSIAARPGYSEHQTGLALDILRIGGTRDGFIETEEYQWLLENSWKYGFILRYPKDKKYITGYDFESWHYRYLGKDLAEKVYKEGITYDEYYAFYIAK